MKTTKYIFLALLAALLIVPSIGRAQNQNTLTANATGTILGLDCSVAANKTAIENLLFASATVSATDDGANYTLELQCNSNIIPSRVQLGTLTLNDGAAQVGTTTKETTAGGKITIVIDNVAADGTNHTIEVTGYEYHTFSFTLSEPSVLDADNQQVKLTVTDATRSAVIATDAAYNATAVTDFFTVTGATANTLGAKNVTLEPKEGTVFYGGATGPVSWNPITQVAAPTYNVNSVTSGIISNEGTYPVSSTTTGLSNEFVFNADYYAGLATFKFKNSTDGSIEYVPSTMTLDRANNKWSYTLPATADAKFMTSEMEFTKRNISTSSDIIVTATPPFTMDGDVYVFEWTGSEIDVETIFTLKDKDRVLADPYYSLVKTTDYTVSGDTKKTDIGNYTITYTGDGFNYTGAKEVKWRIVKSINNSYITVTVDPVVYKAEEYLLADVKSKVIVKDNGSVLTEGTHYNLTLKAGHQPFLNAKTYVDEIVITGISAAGYADERYASFVVQPKDIATTTITAETGYTGSEIAPATYVTVEDGTTPLTVGTDYIVTVKDISPDKYQEIGTYADAITITAKDGGNYTGSKTVDFKITGGTSINASSITVTVTPVVYKGAAFTLDDVKALVVVKDGATTLTEGTNYTLAILTADNKNAKTYVNDIVITGKGTYYGSRNADFVVTPKDIALCSITAETGYTGSEIAPATYVTVEDGSNLLTVGTDYNVTVKDISPDKYQEIGTYADAITITAKDGGNYTGSKTVDFNITGGTSINASSITVTVDPVVYKGAAFTLDEVKSLVVVKNGATKLTEGTHYTLTILTAANQNAKTYVNDIVITGKGPDYFGSRTADFTVTPKDIALCTITAEAPYTGSVIDPAEEDGDEYKFVKVKDGATSLKPKLGAVGDFTMTVKSDTYKDAGTYTDAITINAVIGGNYTGSKVVDFLISGGTSINDAAIAVIVDPVVYKGEEYTLDEVKGKVVVKNTVTNTVLAEGTDYDLTKLSTYENAKTYTNDIIITAKGEYYGTRTADFIINPKDFQLCSIVASAAYTGSEFPKADIEANTPTVYVIVKDGTKTLAVTTDYNIVAQDPTTYPTGTPWGAYKDAGTYANAITVTAVAGGNYTGHQTVDFVVDHAGFDVASALIVAKDIYTGAALPPKASSPAEPDDNIIVTLGGKELTYGTEYTIETSETADKYVDAKTYENAITIKGIGEYYGEVTGSYVIQPRAFADADVTINVPDLNYNAADQAPVPEVKYLTNVIPADNYTFTPATVKEAGTYTLNFEGQYNLTGTKTAEVKVLKELDGTYTDDFVITIVPDQPLVFDGVNPVEPEVKVTDNGKELVEGTDYTVAYSGNDAEGEGTITITGAGVYSGTKTLKFPIIAAYFTQDDYTYHTLSSTTVALGTQTHDVATTKTDNNLTVPAKVTRTIGTNDYDFDVVGVEEGAFKALTTMYTLTLPASIEFIEDKAFEGCTALRWIDASTATALVPSSLDRTIEATPFYGVPAQALVFLTDNKVEGENYIYMVGAGDFRCDVFKIYDDVSGKQNNFTQADGYQWAYENPYDFKANSVVNTRQLTGEQHYTTCLPYDLAIPANVKAYQLTASTDPAINPSSTLIGFNEVSGTLEAFKPYVLIPSASGQLLCAGETDIPKTVGVYTDADAHYLNKTPGTGTAGSYVMYGTMRFKKGDGKQYIMQDKNVWKLTDGTGWNGGTGACVLPMRAYIAKEGDYPVKPFLNANYTEISELDDLFDEAVNDGTVRYDLAGRKVSGNVRKGIYIVNGKKMVMGK